MIDQMKTSMLKTVDPFKSLFPIAEDTLNAVIEDISSNGFDHSKPIDIWGNIIIDGHTRLKAVKHCGIQEVSVFQHDFPDEQAALEYAVHNQRNRRNMTDADIARCVRVLDKKKPRGGDRVSDDAKNGAITLVNVIAP